MKLNVTDDPNLFEPDYKMLTRLPKSCCIQLSTDGQCTSEFIYEKPCDPEHLQRVHKFTAIAFILTISALVWKIVFFFIYKYGSDSLFVEFQKI